MKWLLFLAIIAWLDVPAWMVSLWAVCFIVDAAVWFVKWIFVSEEMRNGK